jgi:hypothetical protein
MSYTNQLRIISVMILLTAITIGGAYASTVTVSGGQISQAGDVISVPVTLDVANNGLIYYQMTITVGDPTVAQVTKVDFPTWAGFHNVITTLPATTVVTAAGDFPSQGNPFQIQAGALNVPIATVTLQGLKPGSTPVTVQLIYQDLAASNVHPAVQAGTIQVGGVVPTTTVTTQATTAVTTQATTAVTTQATTAVTTEATTAVTTQATTAVTTQATTAVTTEATTVVTTQATTAVPTTEVTTTIPTTAPYTGPTGQAYLTTTPQGAHIVLDGVPSNAITPVIMTVPVGNHDVIFKLAGYDEVQANFEAKTNTMATISRRLSPGSSVIPTTPGTTVVTTVPTTTVTALTTVPTIIPTTYPTSQGSGALQIPSWATRFMSLFKFPWG